MYCCELRPELKMHPLWILQDMHLSSKFFVPSVAVLNYITLLVVEHIITLEEMMKFLVIMQLL